MNETLPFLTSPFIQAILIMVGLTGIFYGIKTGHLGSVAIIGLASILLFFGAQYYSDVAGYGTILIFFAGVILLLLEVFVIPGFGVAGVSGILLIVAGLLFALTGDPLHSTLAAMTVPLFTLAGGLVGFGVVSAMLIHYLPTSNAFSHLSSPGAAGGLLIPDMGMLPDIGDVGLVLTTLRPSGTVQIDSERYHVLSEGEFIQKGEQIEVVRLEGRKIIVQRTTRSGPGSLPS